MVVALLQEHQRVETTLPTTTYKRPDGTIAAGRLPGGAGGESFTAPTKAKFASLLLVIYIYI
jgi:hypothetical protein